MGQVDSLRTGKRFKNTEIGEIPVYWEVSKLEKVISLKYGEGLPENEREGKPYPVYGSNGIVGYHSKFLVNGPGIIVGRKGSIGSITWSDRDFWPIDTTYYVTTDLNKTNFRWLFYYLIHLRLDRLNAATGIPGLNRQVALETKIAIPPLPEQKKIAEILSTVDDAIEKSNEIIEKTRELKKGLMQELLTRGIGHKKFKKTKIGKIPVDWETKPLSDVADFKNGHAFYVDGYSNEGKKVIDMLNITLEGELDTNPDHFKYVSLQVYEKYKDFHLNKNELVIVMTDINPKLFLLGKTAIIDKNDEYVLNQRVGRLRLQEDKIDLRYLHYYTNSSVFLKQIHFLVNGTAQFYVNTPDIVGAKIAAPPLTEQKKIAEILSAVDEGIEKEVENKKELEIIKKALMQVLLTGEKRVKV